MAGISWLQARWPGLVCWYGLATREYWALTPWGLTSAGTPSALDASLREAVAW